MAKKKALAPVLTSLKEHSAQKLERTRSRADAWENILSGLGTSRDKRASNEMAAPANSNAFMQSAEDLFTGDDLAANIAEIPAKEMTRKWLCVKIDDVTANDPNNKAGRTDNNYDDTADTAKIVAQAMEELHAPARFFEAKLWARVHGGAVLFLGVDDGSTDLSLPLNENAIRKFSYLKVFTRWDVQPYTWYGDLKNDKVGLPETYRITINTPGMVINGKDIRNQMVVHESRLIRFDGALCSPRRMLQNNGWHDSVFIRTAEIIRDYGSAWGGVAHLLTDFAQAVFKIQGLADMLASENNGLVIDRLITLDMARSVTRAIPLDAETESFERQATPLNGYPELLQEFMHRLSSASRIPVSLLFGRSAAGMNATGESDVRFFYDYISSEQEWDLKPKAMRFLKLLFLSADGPTKGVEPPSWSVEFNPLWQLSEGEQATARKTQADADCAYIDRGVLNADEVAASRFSGDRFSYETRLDHEQRDQDKLAEEAAIKAGLLHPTTKEPIDPTPEPAPVLKA